VIFALLILLAFVPLPVFAYMLWTAIRATLVSTATSRDGRSAADTKFNDESSASISVSPARSRPLMPEKIEDEISDAPGPAHTVLEQVEAGS